VDTRNGRGYALLPPSRTVDGSYSVLIDADVAPAPEWIARVLNATRKEKATTAPDVELDTPSSILRAVDYLKRHEAYTAPGQGSDTGAFVALSTLRDLGISQERAVELMMTHFRCYELDEEWVEQKAENAYRYAENAAGAYAVQDPSEAFAAYTNTLKAERPQQDSGLWEEAEKAKQQSELDARRAKYRGVKPSEGAKRQKGTFWDADKTLPRRGEGTRIMFVAEPSQHKTNLVLAHCLDAIRDQNARVVFCAGESAEEFMAERVPTMCAARGIAIESLDSNLVITEACPRLTDAAEVEAFIAEYAEFNPDIVVLDTFSEAMTGVDESAAKEATIAMDAAGVLRKSFKATVILVHHLGKDGSKGARGSSVYKAAVDALIVVKFDRDSGVVTAFADKVKGGKAKFIVAWGTRVIADVMTVVALTCGEREKAVAAVKAAEENTAGTSLRRRVMRVLAEREAYSAEASLNRTTLARQLAGDPKKYPTEADYETEVGRIDRALDNGSRDRHRNGKVALRGCFEEVAYPPGLLKPNLTKRWFRKPEREPWEEDEAKQQEQWASQGHEEWVR
jgi:hypothetical protein